VKVNGKALEQQTALAVSAWLVPLSPLGLSVSNPITGFVPVRDYRWTGHSVSRTLLSQPPVFMLQ
jgi:hypothetical protein